MVKRILSTVLIYAIIVQPLLCEINPFITQQVIEDALKAGAPPAEAYQHSPPAVVESPATMSPRIQKELEIMESTYLLRNKIITGDILLIDMVNKRYIALVDKDEYAELPFIGRIKITGKTIGEIEKIFSDKQLIAVVKILTVPQGIDGQGVPVVLNLVPKGVTCLGEFNRQSVVPAGTLSECIGNSFGLTPASNGIIVVHKRDQKFEIDYNDYLAGKCNKNITCEAGMVLYAKKSPGAAFLDGIGPTLSKLRDAALVVIAFIELKRYGKSEGWW